MRLLQRYILFELLRVFLLILSGTTILLVFVGVFNEVSKQGLGPEQVLDILPYLAPSMLPFTIPATLLLSICIVYGRLSGDREIVAAKAAGINALSLLWPAFFLGSVLSVGSLLLTDQVIPWAVGKIQRKVTLAMEDILLDMLRTQHQMHNPDWGIAIRVDDVRGKTLIMPTIRYKPAGRSAITLQAQQAELDFDIDRQQVTVRMHHGHVDAPGKHRMWFADDQEVFPLMQQGKLTHPRHLSIQRIHQELDEVDAHLQQVEDERLIDAALTLAVGDFDRMQGTPFLTYHHLQAADSQRRTRLTMEIHSRFALASSCFFFVVFGAPFAVLAGKKQVITSFMFCFLPILLAYYPVVLLMNNLCKTGTVNPAWAMWVGNALLLCLGLFILRKVLQH